MKIETYEGTVEAYQGKDLPKPIKFSGEVEVPETVTEAKEKGLWPSDSEMLRIIVTKAVTAAKANAYQKATKELKESYEASPEFKRAQFLKAAIAAGLDAAAAEAILESMTK